MDDEHVHHSNNNNGTWNNKSGSSGYDSQPHSDHSSLDKGSPPAKKCLRNETTPPSSSPPPPSDGSSGSPVERTAAPWLLSPIKEGVIDVHQYCIPRPVWPGHADGALRYSADPDRIPRVKCCRHCARCRCRSNSTSSSSTSSSTNSAGGGRTADGAGGGSFSGYSSASGGGTVSTGSTSSGRGAGSCSDDVHPSPAGSGPVVSNQSPLALDPRFGDGVGVNKALVDNWNSVDLMLNQKTDNLHYVSTY